MNTAKSHPLGWLPNALTVGRIALVPILIWGILAVGSNAHTPLNAPILLPILFIFCAFTDFLDGFFARKWELVSDFGRMLDPIADKLMVAGCLIALNINFGTIWYILIPTILIIFRDIFVSGLREHAALSGRKMPPTSLAKWKTAAEMLAIFLLLFAVSSRSVLPISESILQFSTLCMRAGCALLWIAAILSAFTGLHYYKAAMRT
jgi:CDP-diacylglycerol--glycerol-3-phosphate 3-phosphatidyltransferase